MTNTTNYNLNIVEGTDVVNPLVQFNPNFTAIDTAMKANADASVSAATCVKSGTNHAVTRTNTDASVFKFTATGDWNTGDTMTVDSVPVTVYTPNGTSPLTGAYVINTDVIASINGTRVVIYTANTQASSIDAIDVVYDNSVSGLSAVTAQGAIDELRASQNVVYDNSVSGLTANNVQAAIDELAAAPTAPTYTKVADIAGSQSYASQLTALDPLFNALTAEQKGSAFIKMGNIFYHCFSMGGRFCRFDLDASGTYVNQLDIYNKTYKYISNNFTQTDISSSTNNNTLELWALV